jgi:HAD superfamily hydrolase (TIGR01509 family)
MPKISFVYFDVGGVLVKDFSDSDKWPTMLRDMGVKLEDIPAFDKIYNEFEQLVCEGKHHVDELVPRLIKEFSLPIPVDFSMQQYFLVHFDKNVELWPIVKELAKSTKIGLLTGQYPGLLAGIKNAGLFDFDDWSAVIDTSHEGINKPDTALYKRAESKAAVPATEILFVDNREKNLVPARELGWQTFLYDSRDYGRATRDLQQFLLQFMHA